jgi:uncharacterized membrane protein
VSPGTDGGRPGIAALLIFWTLGVHGGVAYSFKAWFGGKGYLSFFWLLLGLPFGAFSLFLMHLYGIAVSPVILATLVLVPTVNLIFSYLLKAPSRAGQEILDAFEGFKLYLTIAEQDRLNLLNPPEETPEVFSRFLPYALALEVEQAWCKSFDAMLAESNYRPSWYHGTRSTAAFSRSFSNGFSSALSSAGAAPGSSSVSGGSGGGGSSGGGGGGGGGGGW